MSSVIYKIVNLVNDKFYVGSTTNQKVRFRQHRKLLRENRHHCRHLQAAWNKYGEDKFEFRAIEDVPEGADLLVAEDVWLKAHVGQPYCYNTGASAAAPWRGVYGAKHPSFGKPVSQQQKTNISETLKSFYAADYANHPRVGKQHTAETRAKISAAKLANPVTPWLGKARSEETRKKVSEAQRGKPKAPGRKVSEEGRAKIRANIDAGRSHMHWKGRAHSEASRAKMSTVVYVRKPDGTVVEYPSLTYMRDELGISIATTIRACKSGKAVHTGVASGWVMSYEPLGAVSVPPEFAHLPRTRQLAKEAGAPMYFTGEPCAHGHIAPRKTKGTCVECAKIEGRKSNERKRLAKGVDTPKL